MHGWLKAHVLLFVLLFATGCATERHITPTVSGPVQSNLHLKQPILGAVLDGRAVQKPDDTAAVLQQDLAKLYGTSIKWGDYFEEIPKGHVGLPLSEEPPRKVTLNVRGLGPTLVEAAVKDLICDGLLNAAFLESVVLTVDLPSGRAWAVRRK